MSDGAPKRSIDLVMERLRKKDAEQGGSSIKPMTEEQKRAIADARKIYDTKAAEREIMHRDKMYNTFDPEQRQTLHEQYLKDMQSYAAERDAAIEKIRGEHEQK